MPKKMVMQYRRKREGRTDYKKRLTLLRSGMPRLVIRASNKSVQVQLIEYDADGDKVIATARATELRKLGWTAATGNTPAAYLTGSLLAHKLKDKGLITAADAIVDIGRQTHHKGGRLYAVVKGAIDAGMAVRVGDDILPSDERIAGKHLSGTAQAMFQTVKAKILK